MAGELISQWTRLLGSPSNDEARSISTSADGSIYITGYTRGSLDGQTNTGEWDAFISKYSSDGTKAWTRLLGSTSRDDAFSISTDADGSIYITGGTQGSLDGQTNSGEWDAFISKYSSDGTKAWTRILGSPSWERAESISTAADGSIYITGLTRGALDGQTNNGDLDAFISKYSSDGTKVWTRLLGSTSDDGAHSIRTAADGSIYIAGYTQGWLDGQTGSLNGDAFISKYRSDGTKAWTRLLGSYYGEDAFSISAASDSSIYITGYTGGSDPNLANYVSFISKYSSDGTKAWTRQLLGGLNDNGAQSISIAADGSIYTTGWNTRSFDEQTNSGGLDAIISKYSSNTPPTGTPTLSGTLKAGQVITIDKTPIQDADNFTGYTPTFNYSFEVSNDNGATWTKLASTDATDNNSTYTLTTAEVGKKVRGVVSYLDGYGTQESVASAGSSPIQPSINLDIGSTSTTVSKTTKLAATISRLILTGTSNINGTGNALNNHITGSTGNNILDGGAGIDILAGGVGNDTYIVDSIYDSIIESANEGIDLVKSSVNWILGANLENLTLTGSGNLSGTGNELSNAIIGNSGNNILDGGAGNDTLEGNSGNDTLIGGLGNDVMKGGAGNDTYYVDSVGDTISDSSATDTVISSISWTLGSNLENLTLTGTDALTGIGNTLNNTIIGSAGNNVLDGLGGMDILTGGAGADVFRFSTKPNFGAFTADHITDFKGSEGDLLQISKSAFGLASNATASLTTVNSASALTTALGSTTTFVYDSSNGNLYWNQNGNKSGFGTGGIFAVLDNKSALTSSNISLF